MLPLTGRLAKVRPIVVLCRSVGLVGRRSSKDIYDEKGRMCTMGHNYLASP